MGIAYFNGNFLPKDEIKINPDDRGFLFADGIYEVVRWYQGHFYDIDSHLLRLKRSLKELRIIWAEEDSFPYLARELITLNELEQQPSLVYIQITRGVAPRTHDFPSPAVSPTVYAFARNFMPDSSEIENGVDVLLKKEMRWSRCDIKSVSLLPNTLSFQEAKEQGYQECIFIRDGLITEGTHSNIFFVINGSLFTHPESEHILSGITRKNILRIAREEGIPVSESAVPDTMIDNISEAFLASTGAEVTPVIKMGDYMIGDGHPGPITKLLKEKFQTEIIALRD
ncbi:MAG TPA: aminotransferase class IV [Bacteroidales bacterium]|nr:aminotransferase class IV [Bacteroidales bacterium]